MARASAAINISAMKIARVSLIGLVAFVGGCGSSTPVLLNASPEGVVVRYSQGSTSADAVVAATQYCAQYGRTAVQGEGNAATGDTFVSFTCRKP